MVLIFLTILIDQRDDMDTSINMKNEKGRREKETEKWKVISSYSILERVDYYIYIYI